MVRRLLLLAVCLLIGWLAFLWAQNNAHRAWLVGTWQPVHDAWSRWQTTVVYQAEGGYTSETKFLERPKTDSGSGTYRLDGSNLTMTQRSYKDSAPERTTSDQEVRETHMDITWASRDEFKQQRDGMPPLIWRRVR